LTTAGQLQLQLRRPSTAAAATTTRQRDHQKQQQQQQLTTTATTTSESLKHSGEAGQLNQFPGALNAHSLQHSSNSK